MLRKFDPASAQVALSKNNRDLHPAKLSPNEVAVLYGMIIHGQKNTISTARDIAKALLDVKIALPTRAIQITLGRLCHWRPADGPNGPVWALHSQRTSRHYYLDQSRMLANHSEALMCVEIERSCRTHAVPMATLTEACSKSLHFSSDHVDEFIGRLSKKRYLRVFHEACPLVLPTPRVAEEFDLIRLLAGMGRFRSTMEKNTLTGRALS